MRATTPLDELEYKGDIVQLAQPMYPIGTKIDISRLAADDYAYYARNVVRQALRRVQEIIYSLKAEGYMEDMVGKKMLPHNKASIRQKLDTMRYADSVEIAGFGPEGMHAVGTIGNQCYLQSGQCHSGVSYRCYLLFRRTVDGNKTVYIHPEPIIGECYLKPLLVATSAP